MIFLEKIMISLKVNKNNNNAIKDKYKYDVQ